MRHGITAHWAALGLWESRQRLKIKFFFFFAFQDSDALEFCADERQFQNLTFMCMRFLFSHGAASVKKLFWWLDGLSRAMLAVLSECTRSHLAFISFLFIIHSHHRHRFSHSRQWKPFAFAERKCRRKFKTFSVLIWWKAPDESLKAENIIWVLERLPLELIILQFPAWLEHQPAAVRCWWRSQKKAEMQRRDKRAKSQAFIFLKISSQDMKKQHDATVAFRMQ